MKVSKYFSMKELTHSNTALNRGIDNIPNETQKNNLSVLANTLLDPIREFLGRPLNLTCAFRNEQVNKLVGGVANSFHVQGKAGDMIIYRSEMQKTMEFIKGLEFDQAIVYPDRGFIHINHNEKNRKQLLISSSKSKYNIYDGNL